MLTVEKWLWADESGKVSGEYDSNCLYPIQLQTIGYANNWFSIEWRRGSERKSTVCSIPYNAILCVLFHLFSTCLGLLTAIIIHCLRFCWLLVVRREQQKERSGRRFGISFQCQRNMVTNLVCAYRNVRISADPAPFNVSARTEKIRNRPIIFLRSVCVYSG